MSTSPRRKNQSPRSVSGLLFCLLFIALTPLAEAQSVLRGPYLQSGTTDSGIVRWRTDVPTDSVVRYGTEPEEMAKIIRQHMRG